MNASGFAKEIAATRQRLDDLPEERAPRDYYLSKLQRLLAQQALHTLVADLHGRDVELQFCNATNPVTDLPCQAPLVLEPPGIASAPAAGTVQCFVRCPTCGRDHVYFVTGTPAV